MFHAGAQRVAFDEPFREPVAVAVAIAVGLAFRQPDVEPKHVAHIGHLPQHCKRLGRNRRGLRGRLRQEVLAR